MLAQLQSSWRAEIFSGRGFANGVIALQNYPGKDAPRQQTEKFRNILLCSAVTVPSTSFRVRIGLQGMSVPAESAPRTGSPIQPGRLERVAGQLGPQPPIPTMLGAAVEGLGLAQVPEPIAAGAVKAGKLVRALEPFARMALGVFLYYSGYRQMMPKLLAFIDHVKGRSGATDKARSHIDDKRRRGAKVR